MICIVIPTLNCAMHLSMLLPQLDGNNRIVIEDGGSTDETISVAVKKAQTLRSVMAAISHCNWFYYPSYHQKPQLKAVVKSRK